MTAAPTTGQFDQITASNSALRAFLHGLPGVDQVGAEGRAANLATRSIKTSAKAWAIDLAISMIDLTTLEGADTPGKVRALCAKAQRPDPASPDAPHVAAVCVYNDLVGVARDALGSAPIHVAAVATAFPRSSTYSLLRCSVQTVPSSLGRRFPRVTRSSAIPRQRIASDARTP